MRLHWIAAAPASAALLIGLLGPAAARPQDEKTATRTEAKSGGGRFASRQELYAAYEKQFAELDRRRIADLADLAAHAQGNEAEAAYQDLFNLAVTRNEYAAAEKAAEAYLARGQGVPQTRALAAFIDAIAAAERKADPEALQVLGAYLKNPGAASGTNQKLDPNLLLAVGEGFLQRLIRDGRYESARKVAAQFAESADPTVKSHFAARVARLDMLGKAAPPIEATDLDGRKVGLSALRGKVVLIDFWASWAPPCMAEIPTLNALRAKYGRQGFEVLGVNLDGARKDIRDRNAVPAYVRRVLLGMQVAWPNVLNGAGAADFAQAYGVTEVPANFLVDRDGKIVRVELHGTDLDQALSKLVAGSGGAEATKDRPASR